MAIKWVAQDWGGAFLYGERPTKSETGQFVGQGVAVPVTWFDLKPGECREIVLRDPDAKPVEASPARASGRMGACFADLGEYARTLRPDLPEDYRCFQMSQIDQPPGMTLLLGIDLVIDKAAFEAWRVAKEDA